MDEENVCSRRDQRLHFGSERREGRGETGDAVSPRLLDPLPVEAHFVPLLGLHPLELVRRGAAVVILLQVEAGLQWNIDDPAAKEGFSLRQFFGGKRAE